MCGSPPATAMLLHLQNSSQEPWGDDIFMRVYRNLSSWNRKNGPFIFCFNVLAFFVFFFNILCLIRLILHPLPLKSWAMNQSARWRAGKPCASENPGLVFNRNSYFSYLGLTEKNMQLGHHNIYKHQGFGHSVVHFQHVTDLFVGKKHKKLPTGLRDLSIGFLHRIRSEQTSIQTLVV